MTMVTAVAQSPLRPYPAARCQLRLPLMHHVEIGAADDAPKKPQAHHHTVKEEGDTREAALDETLEELKVSPK